MFRRKQILGYAAVSLAALIASIAIGYTPIATSIDNFATDWMFRLHRPAPWQPQSIILAIDDASYSYIGSVGRLRGALARAIVLLEAAKPKAIAIDVILADQGDFPQDNEKLAKALAAAPNVILDSELVAEGWENPLPQFAANAKAIGHAHIIPDKSDGMCRFIHLEAVFGRKRLWALSFEAFRVSRGKEELTEYPDYLQLGPLAIPASQDEGRRLRIRYLPPAPDRSSRIPRVSLKRLLEDPALAARFKDKVVFIGATAQSTSDKMMTPYTTFLQMPGVEIHAQAFETLSQGRFLLDASPSTVFFSCLVIVCLSGLIFTLRKGVPAYLLGGGVLAAAHVLPHIFFLNGIVIAFVAPALAAWLSVSGCASYQYFFVRRQLRKSEGEKARYQQAIHFVTHEMRTPLTAIQGSSEIMGRYKLSEEKQKQMAQTINAESKRLARMIQTFLDVERLSDGQMELKKEPFAARLMIQTCLDRAAPIAERKSMRVEAGELADPTVIGDRELMEYAVYNLLTNAVKYSPAETQVTVKAVQIDGELRLSVKDQGMGMDEKELRNIFTKFYRTKRAEASGEAGTGIGLSIVHQIVTFHGGKMEVTSEPGRGSCFTMILPVAEKPICSASS
jgi:signal transduction histidine kinase